MEEQARLIEALHKACGGLELARDLVERSGSVYAQGDFAPDNHIARCFNEALHALSRIVDALNIKLGETSLGPAA